MDKKMKKLLTSFKGKEKGERSFLSRSSSSVTVSDDSPEALITKAISDFCQSGGPHNANPGEEVLHLPTIVDAAESSPTAAKEAAILIRKNLEMKNASKPYLQYNSIMLIRILCDHPGRTFTRNLSDPKFGGAVKALLREGRDPSVWQILSETLDHFEKQRLDDEGLQLLREVWAKEKKHMAKANVKTGNTAPPGQQPAQFPTGNGSRPPPQLPPRLPPPEELVGRISEAQTSAKLLEQVLQSTPQAEIPTNELIKEFADRCRIASRSVQGYVQADPPADEDTLTTLIETNDVLTTALNRHQTAVAAALKKQETHRTKDSRMMTIGDPSVPELFAPIDHDTRPSAGVPIVGSVGMHGAQGSREDEEEEHSPVSPISPQQSHQQIQYRY